jgi:hypothetical protein
VQLVIGSVCRAVLVPLPLSSSNVLAVAVDVCSLANVVVFFLKRTADLLIIINNSTKNIKGNKNYK